VLPIDQRGLLLRAAVALRQAAAALARRARGPDPGPGRQGVAHPASPPPGEDGGAFLEHVRDTLLDLSTRPPEAPPRPAEARPRPAPRAPGTAAGLRAGLRRLAALLEPVRRHEDVVLAVALLVGIAVMILHWVR
jgi:hypothetical protein